MIINLTTPLVPLSVVQGVRDCTDMQALALVEDGTIEYGFNIASRKAGRRCLRVFAPCLVEGWNNAGRFDDLDAVITAILPPAPGDVPGTVLAVRWACDSHLILKLLREGSLRRAAGSPWGKGPNGSPRVCRASIVEFLKTRRVL